MGGQNNLPADTGRSDLRTWGVSERAGRGPGPRGGRGAEIGDGGNEEKRQRPEYKRKRWRNKLTTGRDGEALKASSFADDDSFNEATVNSHCLSLPHRKIPAIRVRNWPQISRVCPDKPLVLLLLSPPTVITYWRATCVGTTVASKSLCSRNRYFNK